MRYTVTAIYQSGRVETHEAKSDKERDTLVNTLSKIPTINYVTAKERK